MKNIYLFLLCAAFLTSCEKPKKATEKTISKEENIAQFTAAMRKHLDAVEKKDLSALQSTMSPDGQLFFMLDKRPLTTTSTSFMDFHKAWFSDTLTSSITFEIKHTVVGDSVGIAITESMYREPNRNGKAYWHKMSVSYAQKKLNGQWYVIKDQATSIEKSTD